MLKIKDNIDLKEILEKFNKEVEKAELTRNPYSNEDKKFKHIIVSLSEEHFNIFKDILDYITNLQEENERLKRENKIMENYLQLIIDIGYDYDGYNDVEGLKNIIDELVQYASLGKNKNDKKSMSIDGNNKRYNILGEELKEKSNKE